MQIKHNFKKKKTHKTTPNYITETIELDLMNWVPHNSATNPLSNANSSDLLKTDFLDAANNQSISSQQRGSISSGGGGGGGNVAASTISHTPTGPGQTPPTATTSKKDLLFKSWFSSGSSSSSGANANVTAVDAVHGAGMTAQNRENLNSSNSGEGGSVTVATSAILDQNDDILKIDGNAMTITTPSSSQSPTQSQSSSHNSSTVASMNKTNQTTKTNKQNWDSNELLQKNNNKNSNNINKNTAPNIIINSISGSSSPSSSHPISTQAQDQDHEQLPNTNSKASSRRTTSFFNLFISNSQGMNYKRKFFIFFFCKT